MVSFLNTDNNLPQSRQLWAITRSVLEVNMYKQKKNGKKSKSHWDEFEALLKVVKFFLKTVALYDKGTWLARQIISNKICLEFDNLPEAFSGYKILHLSDLHIDALPNFEQDIINQLQHLEYDICIMTGDYRKEIEGGFSQIIEPMKKITDAINCTDGTYAILGNHDTYLMYTLEEKMNIRFLINESIKISKNGKTILLTGTDDPYAYYTEQAAYALQEEFDGFKIAAVHTPELKNMASENSYDLYLCGHTHGGQICLPNGKPLITHQKEGSEYASGLWRENGMVGYTHNGCGVSGIPVRYNSHGEVTIIELQKKNRYENN